jgi:hypothetical protein
MGPLLPVQLGEWGGGGSSVFFCDGMEVIRHDLLYRAWTDGVHVCIHVYVKPMYILYIYICHTDSDCDH